VRISEVLIRNYRNFRNTKIVFSNNDTVILGENGAGKTNLFRAIRLLVDAKYKYSLKKDDYPLELKYPQAHWIIIQIKLTNVKSEELGSFGAKLNPNDNNEAWINLFFRPVYEERVKIKTLADDFHSSTISEAEFVNYLDSLDFRTDFELIKTVGETLDYTKDENYNALVGDIDSLHILDVEEENAEKMGTKKAVYDIVRLINTIYVPAGRDPYDEMTGSSGLIKNLMSKQSLKVDKEKLQQLRNDLVKVGETIEAFDEFKDTAKQITEKYEEALGKLNAKTTNVSSLISDEIYDVAKYLGLNIADGASSLPLSYRSLGEHSIFHMVLRMVASEDSDKFKFTLLLIEEPEVHLHTHLQRTLFIKLQNKKDLQLIFSTHSNNISYAAKISKMVVLEQKRNNAIAYYPTNGLSDKEVSKTERYLDANRTPLLFAKKVILVEGDAEAITIPWLFEKCKKNTLDEYCVSLVKVDSAFFDSLAILFHPMRINRKCCILTDKDTDFTTNKERSKAENLGLARYNKLNELQKENSLIAPYFAENTFEIQLLDKNIDTLVNILNEKLIYVDEATIEKRKNELKSANNETRYTSILRCVEYIGKGWFAILFVDYCRNNSIDVSLPEYIKKAFEELTKNE